MPNEDVSVVEDVVMKGEQEHEKLYDSLFTKLRTLEARLEEYAARSDKRLDEQAQKTDKIYEIVLLFEGTGEFLTRWGNRIRTLIIWLTPIGTAAYWVWKFVVDYKKAKGEA